MKVSAKLYHLYFIQNCYVATWAHGASAIGSRGESLLCSFHVDSKTWLLELGTGKSCNGGEEEVYAHVIMGISNVV